MSITLRPQDVADLVLGTLANLGAGRFTVLAEKFRQCLVVDTFFDRAEMQSGGNGWQRQVMTRFSTAARHSSPYAIDNLQRQNVMDKITGNWVHFDSHMLFNYQEILVNQAGPEQIFNMIMTQRAAMMGNITEMLEKVAWQAPAAGNTLEPLGIPHWVVYNHGNTGFTGGAPAGYTTVAGLNPDTVPNGNWKNYSETYTSVSRADLLKKTKKALTKLDWRDTVKVPNYSKGPPDLRIYTNDTIAEELGEIYESGNDNLGANLGGAAGTTTQRESTLYKIDNLLTIRGRPVFNVPLFETSEYTGPANPLWLLDLSKFGIIGLKGDFFREGRVEPVPSQHNNYACYLDTTYNFWCEERRRHAIIATAAS